MLPRVKIQFLNGQLGTVGVSADGLLALIVGAAAVAATFALNTPYTVTSVDDLADLGITEDNNAALFKAVSQFYDEAEAGTRLVIYGVAPATTATNICDYSKTAAGYARDLITRQNGALRGIIITGVNTGGSAASTNGLDPDVFTALPKAQQLAEWATTELYAPIFIVIEGRKYDATKELKDLTAETYNRVAVLIGDTESGSDVACMGTLAGRIASCPVQRNIGRVKSGSLFPTEMYVGTKAVEEAESIIAQIYDKGYIVPRRYVGKSGYFFADDQMACDPTDDYAHLTYRRTIDKAYRIAYATLLDMLLDELEVNEDGTLQTAVVKDWQQTVEDAINRQMTANGELSATDGEGCKCFIDETQNVLATSKINVTLKVRPFGYARYVDVNLGFLVSNT
ncbi:MAG: hypothetical protein IJ782_02040 [Prevotella sp.]|nr:hypothetical protein [Prevotella sp.]